MSAPTTVSLFLDYVRKSGLIDATTLDDYLASNPQADDAAGQELASRMVRDGLLTSFQATHLLRGRFKNFLIGKFKLLQPLGSGGMSHVYLCEHVTMKHRVALKLLPARESKDPTAVSRFLREARAAATVNHPNLVRAHDFDRSEDGKYYYLIMDYVDGVNLHDLVKKIGPLPVNQAANYISQAAVGLQHIHDCGLIHRDLKPSNLILDRSGIVRITDLGLARFTNDSGDQLTRQISSQAVIGTADYISPEQALNSDSLDIRADIYSLGVTFYFLLSGAAPFEQQSVAQKLLSHQIREPDPIPGLPDEAHAIVSKMLQKKVENRFQLPIEVAEALSPWTSETVPVPDENYFPSRASNTGPGTAGPRTASPLSTLPARRPQSRVVFPSSGTHLDSKHPSTGSLPGLPAADAPASSTLALAPAAPASQPRRLLLLTVSLILLAAAFVFGVAYTLTREPTGRGIANQPAKGSPQPDITPDPNRSLPAVPEGALVVAPTGQFVTLAQALTRAQNGSRIVIVGPEHREPPVRLEALPAGISIEGWPEESPVIWRSANPGSPTLTITRCEGLTLKNIHFDGENLSPVLMELSGQCKTVRLERLQASGFKTAALRIHDLDADSSAGVTVDRLRVLGAGETGILIAGTSPTRHLIIERGRFEAGLRAGIRIQAPVHNVQVQHNRFGSLNSGIGFDASTSSMSLTVANNNFADCATGLEFAELPAPNPAIQIQNNLFFKTRNTSRCLASENKNLTDNEAVWVWFDDRLEKNVTSVPAGTRYFRKTFTIPTGTDLTSAVLDIGCATSFEVSVNDVAVGSSQPRHFTKRVYAFPVGTHLKHGKNVITVTGHHTRDPINSGYATAAGLTVRLGAVGHPAWVGSDESWKVTENVPAPQWTSAGFDDSAWPHVKVWDISGFVLPWQGSIWDSRVKSELNLPTAVPFTAEGNVRDYVSQDTFPLLNCTRGFIPTLAGIDALDDSTYLRTPRSISRLYTIGKGGGPVGVPLSR